MAIRIRPEKFDGLPSLHKINCLNFSAEMYNSKMKNKITTKTTRKWESGWACNEWWINFVYKNYNTFIRGEEKCDVLNEKKLGKPYQAQFWR